MWFFPTKRQIRKELVKVSRAFKERDEKIEKNRGDIETTKEKIARLEGIVSVLMSQKSQVSVSSSSKASQGKIETLMIQRLRKSKKALVIAEIKKLEGSHSIPELFEIVVRQKGLCSKASFYRYVSSLIETKTNKIR